MERRKSIVLSVLVLISLFLFYELILTGDVEVDTNITIENKNVISYKRFFSTSPNRESLDLVPDDDISNFIAQSLSEAKDFKMTDKVLYDPANHSKYKNFDFSRHRGYLVVSGFNVPIRLLSLSTAYRIGNLPFSYFNRAFIDNDDNKIYLNTDKGVYVVDTKINFETKDFSKYIILDQRFAPSGTYGINSFAGLENPVLQYTKDDRQNLAERFLGTKNIYEIDEPNAYTYSSEFASIRIENNGDITYLRSPMITEKNTTLYDSLVSFKNFIKTSLLSFSNYRIMNIKRVDDDTFEIVFLQGSLPHFLLNDNLYTATIKNNTVTSFKYNSMSIKPYDTVVRKPEIGIYKAHYLKDEDPFLVYTGTNIGNVSVTKLR